MNLQDLEEMYEIKKDLGLTGWMFNKGIEPEDAIIFPYKRGKKIHGFFCYFDKGIFLLNKGEVVDFKILKPWRIVDTKEKTTHAVEVRADTCGDMAL